MRLDHIAFRVADRDKTAEFIMKMFGYKKQAEFEIDFPDGSKALCYALEPHKPKALGALNPPHVVDKQVVITPKHKEQLGIEDFAGSLMFTQSVEYHRPPEIFVSQGTPGSIVDKWVKARDGIGGIHHLAYQVESVEETMKKWREEGWAEFTTNEPLTCPGIVQVFTKPHPLTGIIYEFIERDEFGFCKENVKDLMESTKDL